MGTYPELGAYLNEDMQQIINFSSQLHAIQTGMKSDICFFNQKTHNKLV